jgi:hypothetical protein
VVFKSNFSDASEHLATDDDRSPSSRLPFDVIEVALSLTRLSVPMLAVAADVNALSKALSLPPAVLRSPWTLQEADLLYGDSL